MDRAIQHVFLESRTWVLKARAGLNAPLRAVRLSRHRLLLIYKEKLPPECNLRNEIRSISSASPEILQGWISEQFGKGLIVEVFHEQSSFI